MNHHLEACYSQAPPQRTESEQDPPEIQMPFQYVEPCAKALTTNACYMVNSVTAVLITIIMTAKVQAFTVVSVSLFDTFQTLAQWFSNGFLGNTGLPDASAGR